MEAHRRQIQASVVEAEVAVGHQRSLALGEVEVVGHQKIQALVEEEAVARHRIQALAVVVAEVHH